LNWAIWHEKNKAMPLSDIARAQVRKKPLFYYGWVIVGVGFITLGSAFGVWYSFSVFILAIINEFGWSRAATSSIFSAFILSQSMMNLVTGHLQDRYGPRIVIPIGAVVLALALVLTSRSRSLWHFTLAYGFMAGAGVSLMGFASHSSFVPKWFERKRGLALGITMSGIGMGMLLLIPLVERWISTYGWRTAYLFLAGLILLLLGPLNLILARRSPQDLNLRPDGDADEGEEAQHKPGMRLTVVDTAWAAQQWTLPKALRTRRFWFLFLAFFFMAFADQGTLLHAVSVMVDHGLSRDRAAYYFGILGVAGSVGKIVMGYLSDRYGRERTNTLGIILAGSGIFCLMHAGGSPVVLPLLFALFFGLGYGAAAPLLPSVCADIFLGNAFGLIFATIAVGGGIGGAMGAYMAGFLRDLSGTYVTPLSVFILFSFVACLLIWLAAPRKVRRMVRSA
jgi:MFS family permease